jgi:hypothetical protein
MSLKEKTETWGDPHEYLKAVKSRSNVVKHGIFVETDTGERIEMELKEEVFMKILSEIR